MSNSESIFCASSQRNAVLEFDIDCKIALFDRGKSRVALFWSSHDHRMACENLSKVGVDCESETIDGYLAIVIDKSVVTYDKMLLLLNGSPVPVTNVDMLDDDNGIDWIWLIPFVVSTVLGMVVLIWIVMQLMQ